MSVCIGCWNCYIDCTIDSSINAILNEVNALMVHASITTRNLSLTQPESQSFQILWEGRGR